MILYKSTARIVINKVAAREAPATVTPSSKLSKLKILMWFSSTFHGSSPSLKYIGQRSTVAEEKKCKNVGKQFHCDLISGPLTLSLVFIHDEADHCPLRPVRAVNILLQVAVGPHRHGHEHLVQVGSLVHLFVK